MDEELIQIIINEYWHEPKIFVYIPIDIFKTTKSIMVQLYCEWVITDVQKLTNIEWFYDIVYNDNKILFYRKDFIMKSEFVVRIPYGKRSEYFNTINKINSLVDISGMCAIAVNNIPYCLDALLIVETNENSDSISKIIHDSNLECVHGKSITEINLEIGARKWNIATLLKNDDIRDVILRHQIFLFAEKSQLLKDGYDLDFQARKKKIFISYCHKDKERVISIVNEFKIYGLYVWLDEQEIDLGDNILTKMSEGIRECDIATIFVSSNTFKAKTAMYELLTLLRKMINQGNTIFSILLDDVNLDDIMEGLGGYMYYPYFETQDNKELITKIKKALE